MDKLYKDIDLNLEMILLSFQPVTRSTDKKKSSEIPIHEQNMMNCATIEITYFTLLLIIKFVI
jgi:hypothetical protein